MEWGLKSEQYLQEFEVGKAQNYKKSLDNLKQQQQQQATKLKRIDAIGYFPIYIKYLSDIFFSNVAIILLPNSVYCQDLGVYIYIATCPSFTMVYQNLFLGTFRIPFDIMTSQSYIDK